MSSNFVAEISLNIDVSFNQRKFSSLVFDDHWSSHKGEAGLDCEMVRYLVNEYVGNGKNYLVQRKVEGFEIYVFEVWASEFNRGFTLVLAVEIGSDSEELIVITCHPDRRIDDDKEKRKKETSVKKRNQLP